MSVPMADAARVGGGIGRPARIGLVLALLAALVLALRGLDPARALEALASVRGAWVAAAALCYLAILPLWAWQWHLLAPPSPSQTFSRMLRVVTTTSGVLNTTPLLVGEATGIVLLVTQTGLDRTAALSVLAMDQLLVGIAKLVVLATAAVLAPLPDWMTRAALGLILLVAALAALLLFAASRGVWHGRAESTPRLTTPDPLPGSIRGRLAGALDALPGALAPLRSVRRGGGAMELALVKKAAEVCAMLCMQRAFGLDLPVGAAILALGMLNLSTLLPIVPGNIGVYEGAIVLAYSRYGVSTELAVGLAALQHLCYLLALAAPGVLWAGVTRWSSASDGARR
ncbi:MAG TPA: lysylphosphatidylglycerol synthase transmembrane domain-containing protein [Gemmatimonadaceae bacterium]